MRTFLVVPSILLMAGGLGCASQSVNTVSFQRERLDSVSQAVAYAAAEQAVRERFRISQRDPQGGVIRGVARDASGDLHLSGTRGPLGERLGTPPRLRRAVTVRVRAMGGDVEAYCRVKVQENTVDTVRMLTRENTISDEPHDTPADREAGTSRAQNAVWKNRGRDRRMEREILTSIREIVRKDTGGS